MSFWQDILGTTKKTFKLGIKGMRINASATTADRELTLPDSNVDLSTGNTGDVLTKTGSGVGFQLPAGDGISTEIKNAAFIIANKVTYLVDTTIPIAATLPSPTVNTWFTIRDIKNLAGTNPITLTRIGTEKIDGVAANKTLQVNSGSWSYRADGTDWWLVVPNSNIDQTGSTGDMVVKTANGFGLQTPAGDGVTTESKNAAFIITNKTTYLVDTTIAIAATLPAPANNLRFKIRDVKNLASTNPITLTRVGTEKIDGVAANKVLQISNGSWEYWCDGTDWWLLLPNSNIDQTGSTGDMVVKTANGFGLQSVPTDGTVTEIKSSNFSIANKGTYLINSSSAILAALPVASNNSRFKIKDITADTSKLYGWKAPTIDGNWTALSGTSDLARTGSLALTPDRLVNNVACVFDGINDCLASSPALSIDGTFSLNLWLYYSTSNPNIAISNTSNSGTSGWALQLWNMGSPGPNNVSMLWFTNGSYTQTDTFNLGNGWHFYSITRQAGGSTKIYVDGLLINTFASAGYTPSGKLEIGAANSGTSGKFTGNIGEVWVQQDVVWGASLITNLYNLSLSSYLSPSSFGIAPASTITLSRISSEKIDGIAADKILQISKGAWEYWCDGTDWWLLQPNSNINQAGSIGDVVVKTAEGFGLQASTASIPTKLGSWFSTINYNLNDFVTYNGYIYKSLTTNLNKQPSANPSDWELKIGVDFGAYYNVATSLTGTINGDVFVNGDLSITGALTINGDLTVLGDISNGGVAGRTLTVNGKLYTSGLIGLGGTGANGSALNVKDDVICNDLHTFGGSTTSTTGGNGGSVTIGGDFISAGGIDSYGGASQTAVGGSAGAIIIKGNVDCISAINSYGGSTSSGANGGGGASVSITGNANCGSINVRGGNATTSGNGGNSGNITIGDNLSSSGLLYASGGVATGATYNGGASGSISIGGDATCASYLSTIGQDTYSIDGKNGGNITIGGDLVTPYVILSGGSAKVGVTSDIAGGSAGNLTVGKSDANVGYITATGGLGFAPSLGGNGGTLTFGGNLILNSSTPTSLNGGTGVGALGGSGGSLIANSVTVADPSASILAEGTCGGDGGNITLHNLSKVNIISAKGGDATLKDPSLFGWRASTTSGSGNWTELVTGLRPMVNVVGATALRSDYRSNNTYCDFNGDGKRVVTTGTSWPFTWTGTWSVGFHLWHTNWATGTGTGNIFAHGRWDISGGGNGGLYSYLGGTGGVTFNYREHYNTGTGALLNYSLASLSAGWHHFALTRDTSINKYYLYIDGVSVANWNSTNTLQGALQTGIGCDPVNSIGNPGSSTLIGGLAEFWFARDIVWSGTTISNVYNASLSRYVLPADFGSGVNDLTANGSAGLIKARNGLTAVNISLSDGTAITGEPDPSTTGKGLAFNGNVFAKTITTTNRSGITIALDDATAPAILKVKELVGKQTLTNGVLGGTQTAALANPELNLYAYSGDGSWRIHPAVDYTGGSTGDVVTKTATGLNLQTPVASAGITRVTNKVINFGDFVAPINHQLVPIGAIVLKTEITILTPWDINDATIQVGNAGTPSKYVNATETNLDAIAGTVFSDFDNIPISGVAEQVIVTLTDGFVGATQGSASVLIHWTMPINL